MPAAAAEPAPAPVASSEAVHAAFARADSNGDGVLTREEAARLPAIYAAFDEIDTNRDEVLSFDEFAAWLAQPH